MQSEENNYSSFISSYDKGDYRDAHNYFLSEIGALVVNKRSDFVHLLNESGIAANESMTDSELIKLFVEGLPSNKNLKLGAAILFETAREPVIGADGYIDDTANDAVIKASYELMDKQYKSSSFVTPLIVGAAATLGSTALKNRNEKKIAQSTLEQKKIEAAQKMKAEADARRKKIAIEKQKIEAQKKAATQKTLIIGGAIVLGIAIIGFIIYKSRK